MKTRLLPGNSHRVTLWRSRLPIPIGVIILLLCSTGFSLEPQDSQGSPPGTDVPPTPLPRWDWMTNGNRWDARYRRTSDGIIQAVDRLDRLFGDERLNEENLRTRLTLGLGLEHSGRDGMSLLSETRMRISLPRLEERLQIVLDDAFEVDQPDDGQAIADAVRDVKPDAGLRYVLARKKNLRISTDMGVRLSEPVQWFARTRWSLRYVLESWDLRLTETVLWFTKDGWRGISDVNFSRPLPSNWQFRSSSRMTIEEIREGVAPAQTFSMTWQPSKRHAWRLYLAGAWPETPHTRTANYSTGIVFRRRIHRDWLFLELFPSVEFPQEYDYELNTFIGFKFEVIFSSE